MKSWRELKAGEWLIEAKSAWQARRTHLRFSADLIPDDDDDEEEEEDDKDDDDDDDDLYIIGAVCQSFTKSDLKLNCWWW